MSPNPAAIRIPKLEQGHLHEIHAGVETLAAATAFAFAALGRQNRKPILLARATRRATIRMQPYGEGLAGLGIDPARLLIIETPDNLALLRAGLDAARCPGLAGVVLESWGRLAEYDLTASRRLVLAAEGSRVPVIMLRGDTEPRSSATHTRWMIRTLPSIPPPSISLAPASLATRAPGLPTIEMELLRQRGGPAGMRWRLIWDDEHGCFREAPVSRAASPDPGATITPLSGAVVPLSPLRAGQPASRAA